jgi:hypothetical protein
LILSVVVVENDRSGHGKAEDLGQSPKTAAIVLPSESRLIIGYITIESDELGCLSSVRAGDLTLQGRRRAAFWFAIPWWWG